MITVEKRLQLPGRRLVWPMCMDEIEHAGPPLETRIEDFMLGRFDEECLSDDPPESDWSDWFPPPPRLTWDEFGLLTEWVEAEADKHDLWPDPDQYPFTNFEQGDYEWLFQM